MKQLLIITTLLVGGIVAANAQPPHPHPRPPRPPRHARPPLPPHPHFHVKHRAVRHHYKHHHRPVRHHHYKKYSFISYPGTTAYNA